MIYRIQVTRDPDIIKTVIAPYYNLVTYDGCPGFEDFVPDVDNSIWFILEADNEVAGLIKLDSINYTTWMPHIMIDEKHRGNGSEQWGIAVVQYMKARLSFVAFLALTPYESAKRYAERVGFKSLGILPKSLKKDGILMDQHILVLNEETI